MFFCAICPSTLVDNILFVFYSRRETTRNLGGLQHNMRGIITETIRALHQAVTVSHEPTTAQRLDKKLTQGQSKLLVVTLWTHTWCEGISSEQLLVNVTVDPCDVTNKGSAGYNNS